MSFFKCPIGQGNRLFFGRLILLPESCQTYFARIEEVNFQGPELRAVLELNPSALADAYELDEERKLKKRSLLHGIPVLLKARSSRL